MFAINQRTQEPVGTIKRRAHLLLEYPESQLEAVVIQWDQFAPSVFIQLKQDSREPIQFGAKDEEGKKKPFALDYPLNDFVDAATGKIFGREAFRADILFSQRAFALLQPEPDLVLPADQLWECRLETLRSLSILDDKGTLTKNELYQ